MRADWVASANKVKIPFTPIDAEASLTIVLFMFHARLWTLALVVITMGFLSILSIKGRRVVWIYRRVQSSLRRGLVQARPVWYRRRLSMIESYSTVEIPK